MGCASTDISQSPEFNQIQIPTPSARLPPQQLSRLKPSGTGIAFQDYGEIEGLLKKSVYFSKATQKQLSTLISKGKLLEAAALTTFLNEKQTPEAAYILLKGKVNYRNQSLTSPALFGQDEIVLLQPRVGDAYAEQNCRVLALGREALVQLLKGVNSRSLKQIKSTMASLPILKDVSEDKLSKIVSEVVVVFGKAKSTLAKTVPRLLAIREGEAALMGQGGVQLKMLRPKESAGYTSVINEQSRPAEVVAHTDTEAFVIGRQKLLQILGPQIHRLSRNALRLSLQNTEVRAIADLKKEALVSRTKLTLFKRGDVLFEKGDQLSDLVLTLENGLVGEGVLMLGANEVFGMGEVEKSKRIVGRRVVVQQTGLLGILNLQYFVGTVGGLSKAMDRNASSMRHLVQQKSYKNLMQNVRPDELLVVKKLVEGSNGFSVRYIAKSREDDSLYSCLVYVKAKVQEAGMETNINDLFKVQLSVQFPLLTRLLHREQDGHLLFMLEEFVNGWQLNDLVNAGYVSKGVCRVFMAELLLALEYLHSNKIIYRDIKPENIFVDDYLRARLFRLSIAKHLPEGRCHSVIGTPYFIAPEVVSGAGYSFEADLYSLGVTFFEMLFSATPYEIESEDPRAIYEQLMAFNARLEFSRLDKDVSDLLCTLMSLNPKERLPGGSYDRLKAQPFFKGVVWESLIDERASFKPPELPMIVTVSDIRSSKMPLKQDLRNCGYYSGPPVDEEF